MGMLGGIESAIYSTRQAARHIGLITLGNEFDVHGIRLLDTGSGLAGKFKDAKRAELYARRYADLWRSKFTEVAKDVTPKRAADIATKATDYRLRSIAATEAWQAANEERRQAAFDLQRGTQVVLVEIWDAMMDACEDCWALDGSESEDGDSFPFGETPGEVHPYCRCTSHFISRYR
jgi:hypothetical protein